MGGVGPESWSCCVVFVGCVCFVRRRKSAWQVAFFMGLTVFLTVLFCFQREFFAKLMAAWLFVSCDFTSADDDDSMENLCLNDQDAASDEHAKIDFAEKCVLKYFEVEDECDDKKSPRIVKIPGSAFHVRAGENYAKNKQKAPSLDSLYEPYCTRSFKSGKRTGCIVESLGLPSGAGKSISEKFDGRSEYEFVPDVLVAHFQFPFSTNIMKSSVDGEGGEIVSQFFYCVVYLLD